MIDVLSKDDLGIELASADRCEIVCYGLEGNSRNSSLKPCFDSGRDVSGRMATILNYEMLMEPVKEPSIKRLGTTHAERNKGKRHANVFSVYGKVSKNAS